MWPCCPACTRFIVEILVTVQINWLIDWLIIITENKKRSFPGCVSEWKTINKAVGVVSVRLIKSMNILPRRTRTVLHYSFIHSLVDHPAGRSATFPGATFPRVSLSIVIFFNFRHYCYDHCFIMLSSCRHLGLFCRLPTQTVQAALSQ